MGIVWLYASWFPTNGDRVEPSIPLYVREFAVMWDRVVLGSEHDPELWARLRDQVWAVSLPFLCQVFALLIGLVLAVFGARPADRGRRFLGSLGWVLLVLTFVLAPRAGLYVERDQFAQQGMTKVTKVLGELLMTGGLCAWLVITGALLRVLGAPAAPSPDAALLQPPGPPAGRGPYVVVAALALWVLHAGFQPGHGTIAPEGVRALVASGAWTPALADLCLEVSLLAAVVWACVAPSRTVGLACGVLIVTWAVYWPTSASAQRMYEVESWVPGAAAALCAAGAWALATADRRPTGSRFVTAASALVLFALLVYPIMVVVPNRMRPVESSPPYEGYLPTEVVLAAFRSDTWREVVEGLLVPWRMGVLLHATLAISALLACRGGRARTAGRVALASFALSLAYPIAHACLEPSAAKAYVPAGTDLASWVGWEQRIAGALRNTHGVYDLAVFAAVSTLFRPSPGRREARDGGTPLPLESRGV